MLEAGTTTEVLGRGSLQWGLTMGCPHAVGGKHAKMGQRGPPTLKEPSLRGPEKSQPSSSDQGGALHQPHVPGGQRCK